LCTIALRVCGFTGGVKGKSRVCGFSTCVLVPCGYVALQAVLKVSLGYVALALVYCCPSGCSFKGGVDSKPSIEVQVWNIVYGM